MAAARLRLVARVGAADSTLPRFFGFSVLVHVLFVATLLVLPSLRSRPVMPDSFEVSLAVAPGRVETPVRAAAPPSSAPPAPAKAIEKPKPQPTPQIVEPKKKKAERIPEKKSPDRTTKKKEDVAAAPTEVADARPPEAGPAGTANAPVGIPAVGDERGSVAALEFGGSEFAWYRNSLNQALHSHWRKPILEGVREPLEVKVTFEILRDGAVRNVQVELTSGAASLDRSALRAVVEAAPLPPLPRSWADASVLASAVFRLKPEEL